MLNNNHLKILMGFFGAINEDKKLKGFKFKSPEEMILVEKKIISVFNWWNRIENFFVNNRVSIWIKEAFYGLMGTPYPEYLYNDKLNDYLAHYSQGWSEGYYTVMGLRLNAPVLVSQISTTPELKRAADFSKMSWIKKRLILSGVNKACKQNNLEGLYRFKRILTYEKTG